METELKFRSVCDSCSKSKVKCSGMQPCDRCTRKKFECHFRPIKHRGSVTKKMSMMAFHEGTNELAGAGDGCWLADHERKTWSVFFALYKSFRMGCASLWFRYQLTKMVIFLESRSSSESARASLARLKDWATALGIPITAEHDWEIRNIPLHHFSFGHLATNSASVFKTTFEALMTDAKKRNLPVLRITEQCKVEVNEPFLEVFDTTKEELDGILRDSNGGFLPWGGDIVSRLVCSEKDLSLYLQIVSINLEQLGRPNAFPTTRFIPSTHVLNVMRKGVSHEVSCVARAIQQERFELDDVFSSTTIVFEVSEPTIVEPPPPIPAMRTFSDVISGADDDTNKRLQMDEDDEFDDAGIVEAFSDDDEAWLEGLLKWASEDDAAKALQVG